MKGWGPKKLCMSLETQGNQTFLAGDPGVLAGISRAARKVLRSENLEKAGSVDFKKTSRTEGAENVQAVSTQGPASFPFLVPEMLEYVAFRDSEKLFQPFSRDFPGVFLGNPGTDPGNSHSLLECSDQKTKLVFNFWPLSRCERGREINRQTGHPELVQNLSL